MMTSPLVRLVILTSAPATASLFWSTTEPAMDAPDCAEALMTHTASINPVARHLSKRFMNTLKGSL